MGGRREPQVLREDVHNLVAAEAEVQRQVLHPAISQEPLVGITRMPDVRADCADDEGREFDVVREFELVQPGHQRGGGLQGGGPRPDQVAQGLRQGRPQMRRPDGDQPFDAAGPLQQRARFLQDDAGDQTAGGVRHQVERLPGEPRQFVGTRGQLEAAERQTVALGRGRELQDEQVRRLRIGRTAAAQAAGQLHAARLRLDHAAVAQPLLFQEPNQGPKALGPVATLCEISQRPDDPGDKQRDGGLPGGGRAAEDRQHECAEQMPAGAEPRWIGKTRGCHGQLPVQGLEHLRAPQGHVAPGERDPFVEQVPCGGDPVRHGGRPVFQGPRGIPAAVGNDADDPQRVQEVGRAGSAGRRVPVQALAQTGRAQTGRRDGPGRAEIRPTSR